MGIPLTAAKSTMAQPNPKTTAKAVSSLCMVQIVLCIGIIVAAFYTNDELTKFRNFLVGFVALVSAIVGYYGAYQFARGPLLFFFITQVWGLSSVTNYLYSGVKEDMAVSLYCDQLNIVDKLNSANKDMTERECSQQYGIVLTKIILSIAAVLVSWFSAYFALRLSEKIQDAEADLSRAAQSSALKVLPVSSD